MTTGSAQLGRVPSHARPVTEDFFYDNLNRLDYSNLNGAPNLDVALDAIGNITNKASQAYAYTGAQSGCSYYAHSQPRAVRKIGTSTIYCYDPNGNMVKRAGSTISYTSYNLPSVINSGSNSSTTSYGAFRNRYKQVAVNGGATETTIYVGGLLEKVTRGSLIEYRHQILGGNGAAAIFTRRSGGTPGSDTVYVHEDHLGSPELITNASGAVVLRLSFGAYGERRDGSDWDGPISPSDLITVGNTTRHGFTWHEHLDAVNLIHMNGRVYEPVVGRFLSRDPFIDGVFDSQGPNGYAYVHNNPLAYTDPSGFDLGDPDPPPGPPVICEVGLFNPCRVIGYYHGGPIFPRRPMPPPTGLGDGIGGSISSADGQDQINEMQTPKPRTCPNRGQNYVKQFLDDAASTILGIADAFSFGYYTEMTEAPGLGAVNHDMAYNAGLYGTAVISGGRLLYAGTSSAIRYLPGISGASAVATRNTLKGVFSAMGADHPRVYSAGAMLMKYGSEAEVINAASRTDATLNTAAAELLYSSASQTGDFGCP